MRVLRALLAIAILQVGSAIADDSIVYDSEQRALDFMALAYASEKGHIVLVEGLLARGAPVDPPPFSRDEFTSAEYLASQFTTPLQAAAESGHLDVLVALLKRKPDLDWACCSGETALYFAAANGHSAVVKALLEAGARTDVTPSPLVRAKKAGHAEVVSLLNGANQDAD